MATVLITGGTGLIGKALTTGLLNKGYRVIILSRSKKQNENNNDLSFAQWDIREQTIDAQAVSDADFIIHLAGAGVADKRWTKKRKQEIIDSRVKSGELIVKALRKIPNKVRAILS